MYFKVDTSFCDTYIVKFVISLTSLHLFIFHTTLNISLKILIATWKISFEFFNFSFTKTICNKVALALAIEIASSASNQVWLEDCLEYIISFVQSDSIQ